MKIIRYLTARFTPKPLRSPVYKTLYKKLKDEYALDAILFTGKRVLILGPAITIVDDLLQIDVSRYDVIVKMNNGISVPLPLYGIEDYRCDILFHSLTEDTRPVDEELLLKSGVKVLVHRTPKRSTFLSTLVAEQRYRKHVALKIIPFEEYESLKHQLGGFSPSTGLTCASFFIKAPVKEVAIVGFTFFSTQYINGYDSSVTSDSAAFDRVSNIGHHSPRSEASLLDSLVKEARSGGKEITLGSNVEAALAKMGPSGQIVETSRRQSSLQG